jgi:hypothetical protein
MFFEQGMELVQSTPPSNTLPTCDTLQVDDSLHAELLSSKNEELQEEWKRLVSENKDMRSYLDQLLALVIRHSPHLLEKKF